MKKNRLQTKSYQNLLTCFTLGFLTLLLSCGGGDENLRQKSTRQGSSTSAEASPSSKSKPQDTREVVYGLELDSSANLAAHGLHIKLGHEMSHYPEAKAILEVCSKQVSKELDPEGFSMQVQKDLCMVLNPEDQTKDKYVGFHEVKGYFLPVDKLQQLLDHAGEPGQIQMAFNDTYYRSKSFWHCYDHQDILLSTDAEQQQILEITLTQINNLSYSCKLKGL